MSRLESLSYAFLRAESFVQSSCAGSTSTCVLGTTCIKGRAEFEL